MVCSGNSRPIKTSRLSRRSWVALGVWLRSQHELLLLGRLEVEGLVAFEGERLVSVVGFTIVRGKIVEIDVLADPERLRQIDVAILDD